MNRTNRMACNDISDNTCHQNEEDMGCSSSLHVSFSPNITVREVLHVFEYTPEEVMNTWYSAADVRAWKATSKQMVRKQIAMDCPRGLENRTPEATLEKRRNKWVACMAVFREQAYQRHEGIYDPEAIADAYYASNERCQVAANMLGMRDETEARLILLEDSSKSPAPIFLVRLGQAVRPVVVTNSAA